MRERAANDRVFANRCRRSPDGALEVQDGEAAGSDCVGHSRRAAARLAALLLPAAALALARPACPARARRIALAALAAVFAWGLVADRAAAQEATVTLTLSPTSLAGSNAAVTDISVTATISAAQTGSTTVTPSLAGTLPSATIPAGSMSATATLIVTPVDDTYWEGSETIVVERGGRIVAEGTREKPIPLTCADETGQRQAGCWGGVRILGNAPVTRSEGLANGVVEPERAAYGGVGPEDSSGMLRYLRAEFAGAAPTPALGVFRADSGTVIEHVQTHASLGAGISFHGGTARCEWCVSSGSLGSGLAWDRGWQGGGSHMYVQQPPNGLHGIEGGNDSAGYDNEPRSVPALSHVTLVAPVGSVESAGTRPRTGRGLGASRLFVTGFNAEAITAGSRSTLLFDSGESSMIDAIFHRNGTNRHGGQLGRGLDAVVAFWFVDTGLRRALYEPEPDPQPWSGSPALWIGEDGTEQFIGAFGSEGWLEKWTFFCPESDIDTRGTDGTER